MEPDPRWKVEPHGPLEEIEPGLWSVSGELEMPVATVDRRMTVVRLSGGRLAIWSAICLDEAGMANLESKGRPAFLIVPSDHHRKDATAWKVRYPELVVVAPPGAREKVAEVVPIDSTAPDFGDADVSFVVVDGTREHEAALVVKRASGTTLVLNDVVANIRDASGFSGWMLKLMGLAGDHAQVPRAVSLMIVKDKEALAAQLRRWAGDAALKRVIVSHGERIEGDVAGTLRQLAESLD